MIYFLDAVISEFIEKLDEYKNSSDLDDQQTFMFMERAINLAFEHRESFGLGSSWVHSTASIKNGCF